MAAPKMVQYFWLVVPSSAYLKPFGVGSAGRFFKLTNHSIWNIICLTGEPLASVHLAAGNLGQKIAPYFTRAGALFFACCVNNNSYNSAKHNYKLD